MDIQSLPRMIDLSAVRTQSTKEERELVVRLSRDYKFVCAFAMPAFTPWLLRELRDCPDTAVGAAVGFPSGEELTSTKVQIASLLRDMGCREFDMVINVSALKDRDYDLVRRDISAVREAVPGYILKVILEVCYLTDDEIRRGAEIAAACGADFVKTGTGWGTSPTTVEHIRLLKSTVGDTCRIKAAGGVRTLSDIEAMVDAGCTRFGIGVNSTINILKEAGIYRE